MISRTATQSRVVNPLISIVVACYNEELALRPLYASLAGAFTERADLRCEFVLVDDGSRDCTPEVLAELAAADRRVTIVTLSRNFGQQAAFGAGLRHPSAHQSAHA